MVSTAWACTMCMGTIDMVGVVRIVRIVRLSGDRCWESAFQFRRGVRRPRPRCVLVWVLRGMILMDSRRYGIRGLTMRSLSVMSVATISALIAQIARIVGIPLVAIVSILFGAMTTAIGHVRWDRAVVRSIWMVFRLFVGQVLALILGMGGRQCFLFMRMPVLLLQGPVVGLRV